MILTDLVWLDDPLDVLNVMVQQSFSLLISSLYESSKLKPSNDHSNFLWLLVLQLRPAISFKKIPEK